ncbi:MAG: hypothetical protein U5L72_19500 [Bacteroidales bacterium]|nr:hypothetical protein [Bacteroidales bacterium]
MRTWIKTGTGSEFFCDTLAANAQGRTLHIKRQMGTIWVSNLAVSSASQARSEERASSSAEGEAGKLYCL